ncbi:MAG TPA: zinc-binding dehydrogenase [Phototrophicaceae bacterium]|nr:zinc-binding dehydrogenase [Phototrophicaceae bacterium]
MKAAVFYQHGSRDVVQVVDNLPEIESAPGMVRVNIKAVALNRLDLWVREGWKGLKLDMPHVCCADGAGVVDQIGLGVTTVAPGDRVGINPTIVDPDCLNLTGNELDCLDIAIMGEHAQGVAAEYVNVPARNLIKLPDHISFAESAATGLVYVTSWYSMITRGGLQAGESVLVLGAGGGVSTASIQIAKLAGCKVYVVGSSAEKCQQAQSLGADVTFDRSADANWSKALYLATGKLGVDVVIDNVGQATLPDSLRSVARGGRILIVGNTSGYQAQIDTRYIFSKQISLIGSSMGPTADFVTVMRMVFDGKLKPVIGKTLPLADIREGHRLLEAGEVFGKIVLEL